MTFFKRLFKTSYQSLLELLAFFPILLIAGINLSSQLHIVAFFIYLFLLIQIGSVIRGVLNVKKRWAQLVIGIIFLSIIIYFQGMTPIYAAGFFILGIISYFRGVRYMEASWENMFPKQIWWIVLMFYIVGFFFYSRVIMLKEYLSYVIVAG
ncbi:MAG: hypothetical protein GX974_01565, partial [Clostridiales bacterium]|nr:hypothetical protein [Clostridiales bacterium]